MEKTYTLYAGKYLDQVPYVSIPGVKTLLDFVSDHNPKAKSAAPESFVEHRIVRLLENSGFFAKLYQ